LPIGTENPLVAWYGQPTNLYLGLRPLAMHGFQSSAAVNPLKRNFSNYSRPLCPLMGPSNQPGP